MNSIYIKFYLTEKHRHQGKMLQEWLLEKAKSLGVPGGSVFRAVAGYGRHGNLHEDNFFELAGDLPVQVEFLLDDKHANQLLGVITAEGLDLPFVRYAVETGTTGAKK
jgi:PII-like signaling protein